MNKQDLVNAISESASLTKAEAAKALNATLEAIQTALRDGQDVVLVGFGSFTTKTRAARTGRNPQTGKAINIAEAKVPSFKAGATLKTAVASA